jgi:hypothetical protein
LTADLAPLIRQWVIDGPAKQGLDRANWTYADLADHLLKTKGIRVGGSGCGTAPGTRPTPASPGAALEVFGESIS